MLQTYYVRCRFTCEDGVPLEMTFEELAEEADEAVASAWHTFWSGLTERERESCSRTFEAIAHREPWWEPAGARI